MPAQARCPAGVAQCRAAGLNSADFGARGRLRRDDPAGPYSPGRLEPMLRRATPRVMRTKLKWIALALIGAVGLWLAFQNPPDGFIPGARNCAAARAIVCLQRQLT